MHDGYMWYFYVLQSIKNPHWFYKGSTNNLQRRLSEHQKGKAQSSAPYRPYQLVYYEAYLYEKSARQRESSVKRSGAVWGALMKRVQESLSSG